MVHQESALIPGPFANSRDLTPPLEPQIRPVAMLTYRSRACRPQSQLDLDRILTVAQERNRQESLTGLLIYDQGCFFQWLEGPREGLMRVWESIRRDPRHCEVEILHERSMPKRSFGSWNMRLVRRNRGGVDAILGMIDAPQDVLGPLCIGPAALVDDAWDRLFADVVLPQLRLAHPPSAAGAAMHSERPLPPLTGRRPAIWHAHRDAGTDIAHRLLAVDARDTTCYLDELIGQGAALEPLFHEVFEPAARCLGDWSNEDRVNELQLTAALGRLQVEVHRLSTLLCRESSALRPERNVLVAPQPGEPHGLNASMSSELFWRDGWDVCCEFPSSDGVLRQLVHDTWFDVLELSSSGALCRDSQLQAMRASVRAAHAASLNPALAVIVDGRSFYEQPLAYLEVGADGGCTTSIDAVPAAQRLIALLTAKIDAQHRSASVPTRPQAASRLQLLERQFRSTVF